ncbi:MAG: hypothetical protein IT436_12070 [Phycisphaerales bacterium]|nr:hypothetical protein [Phycisphaerales bacterium]
MNAPSNPDRTPPPMRELTLQEEKAIIALISESTIKKAAARAEMGERTLHRWLTDPFFAAAYRQARRINFAQAISVCQMLAPAAMSVLGRVMSDPASPPAARVAAATSILKFARESIELDDLVERLCSLERRAQGEAEPATARWREVEEEQKPPSDPAAPPDNEETA